MKNRLIIVLGIICLSHISFGQNCLSGLFTANTHNAIVGTNVAFTYTPAAGCSGITYSCEIYDALQINNPPTNIPFTTAAGSHVFTIPGIYRVVLTLSDATGDAHKSVLITVYGGNDIIATGTNYYTDQVSTIDKCKLNYFGIGVTETISIPTDFTSPVEEVTFVHDFGEGEMMGVSFVTAISNWYFTNNILTLGTSWTNTYIERLPFDEEFEFSQAVKVKFLNGSISYVHFSERKLINALENNTVNFTPGAMLYNNGDPVAITLDLTNTTIDLNADTYTIELNGSTIIGYSSFLPSTQLPIIHTFAGGTLPAGLSKLIVRVKNSGNNCISTKITSISVLGDCNECQSFKPNSSTMYWMSAWVKVAQTNQVKTYNFGNNNNEAHIAFDYTGSNNSTNTIVSTDYFYPQGDIINGWQRIVGKFEIPTTTADLNVNLISDQTYDTYFDDIRIHPFNGSMKSYVYDGETFWLSSELDDNNYATFYEYDNEGGLVRIKKETARGIVTIQETRSNSAKK